jgi:hypothetical protein
MPHNRTTQQECRSLLSLEVDGSQTAQCAFYHGNAKRQPRSAIRPAGGFSV